MRFSARHRLRKAEDFKALQHHGRKINCGTFIFIFYIRGMNTLLTYNRIGIIASRKVGNAVVRNRAKRIFRELFRQHQDILPEFTDILIIARSHFQNKTFDEIKNRFIKACESLNTY